MFAGWEKQKAGCIENIFNGIQNVSPSQLADLNLFDFHNLDIDRSSKVISNHTGSVDVSSTNFIEAINL